MEIIIKLSEIYKRCNNWSEFCKLKKYDEDCIESGLGNLIITLTEDEAKKFEIIK